jgi:DMSO/TMAO reductase YedYZ heme-binding membrane subunit
MSGWEGLAITGRLGAVLVACAAGVLVGMGWNEAAVRGVVRLTAFASLALFLAVFVASALVRRWPRPGTRWLLRNRRWVGLSFAVSHGLHLLALIALGVWFPHPFLDHLDAVTLVAGGGGFVVIAVLAATSNDAAVRRLGAARWRRLHRAGVYYLWAIFTLTLLGGATEGSRRSGVLVGILLAALAFRLSARQAPGARVRRVTT